MVDAAPVLADSSPPSVVASILPVQSLVAAVMEGVGEPFLLVPGGASPHAYALKPSDARALGHAQVVFWVGPNLETFLIRPLDSLATGAKVVALAQAPGIILLPARVGGGWETHHHDDEHEAHADGDHDEHGSGHQDHDHDPSAVDMHMWLDPENARAMVEDIANALSAVDPSRAALYHLNADRTAVQLKILEGSLSDSLAGVTNRPYIVFHDAYQYFEKRFHLTPAGSITISPDRSPGAKRIADIRDRIRVDNAVCVFSEPQFQSAIVSTVIEGIPARTAVLDPLGAGLSPGPDAYPLLLQGIARSLSECLTPPPG